MPTLGATNGFRHFLCPLWPWAISYMVHFIRHTLLLYFLTLSCLHHFCFHHCAITQRPHHRIILLHVIRLPPQLMKMNSLIESSQCDVPHSPTSVDEDDSENNSNSEESIYRLLLRILVKYGH